MLELKDIKPLRKQFGLTQHQLARSAGVSQSVIAKIEAGRIDPSYSTAMRIFATLEQHRRKKTLTARQIMHKGIISVQPSATVAEAAKLMRKHDISQIPVCDPSIVGIVTEATILEHLNAVNKKVSEIMEASPPTLNPETGIDVISSLLRHYPLVFILEHGKCAGVVTKADVLKAMV